MIWSSVNGTRSSTNSAARQANIPLRCNINGRKSKGLATSCVHLRCRYDCCLQSIGSILKHRWCVGEKTEAGDQEAP